MLPHKIRARWSVDEPVCAEHGNLGSIDTMEIFRTQVDSSVMVLSHRYPSAMLLTTLDIPDLSPSYLDTSPIPPLYTALCDATFFVALSYLSRFLTRGFRTLLGRLGVRPLFFRIARVMERGPDDASSSYSGLSAPPSENVRSKQRIIRITEKLKFGVPGCGNRGLIIHLFLRLLVGNGGLD